MQEIYGVLRVKLNMSSEEFGKTTPRMTERYFEQLGLERRSHYFGHGIVAATMANLKRDPSKKPEPWEPLDFVPGAKEPLSLDDAAEKLSALYGASSARR